MWRLIRLHLIDNTNTPQTLFNRNDIAPVIATARGQRHFIKTSSLVRSGNQFLPFIRRYFKSYSRVLLEQRNDFKPRDSDRFDERTLISPRARDNSHL